MKVFSLNLLKFRFHDSIFVFYLESSKINCCFLKFCRIRFGCIGNRWCPCGNECDFADIIVRKIFWLMDRGLDVLFLARLVKGYLLKEFFRGFTHEGTFWRQTRFSFNFLMRHKTEYRSCYLRNLSIIGWNLKFKVLHSSLVLNS